MPCPGAQTEDNPGKVELFLRDGIPVGRNASIELRNMHATYAATWCVSSTAEPWVGREDWR